MCTGIEHLSEDNNGERKNLCVALLTTLCLLAVLGDQVKESQNFGGALTGQEIHLRHCWQRIGRKFAQAH